MITGFLIKGFKAFGNFETQYLPIKPITLLFGQNAAGKSSILQALAWANEIHHTGNIDVHRMKLTGQHANLGGYNSFHYRKNALELEKNQSEESTDFGWSFDFANSIKSLGKVPVSKNSGSLGDRPYDFEIQYEIITRGVSGNPSIWRVIISWGSLQFEFINDMTGKFHLEIPMVVGVGKGSIRLDSDEGSEWFLSERYGTTPDQEMTQDFQEGINEIQENLANRKPLTLVGLLPRLSPLKVSNKNSIAAQELFSDLQKLVIEMGNSVDCFLENISYLGPWRGIPNLAELSMTTQSEGHPELKHWANLLGDDDARDEVNEWLDRLGCRIEISTVNIVEKDKILNLVEEVWVDAVNEGNDDDFIELLAEKLEEAMPSNSKILTFRTPGGGIPITPESTGVGVSQLIPVIAAALTGKGGTLLIEQPELHLHPKLQAEIGDLLIAAAVASNGPRHCFIVETHSEHLILRLLRRVRETADSMSLSIYLDHPLTPNHLSIVHVGRPEAQSELYSKIDPNEPDKQKDYRQYQRDSQMVSSLPTLITCLPVNANGDFDVEWPGGFFADRMQEIFSASELKQWYENS